MAKYRVLVTSFINNAIREEGEIVEYDGNPGSNLEKVSDSTPVKGGNKGGKGGNADAGEGAGADEGQA